MLHRGEVKETITETHQYIYAGGKLLRETISDGTTTKTLDFTYDNVGIPYSLIYNNGTTTTTYYYITNLQGDVMYLVDANGVQVAAYDYDPYGKVITSTGDLAEINPLRYRGYYYDTETSFYYLQSRYYDPEICRFINADSYASTRQGYMGYNMFAYCQNNPIAFADYNGEWINIVIGAVVGFAAGAISAAVTGGSWADIGISALAGGVAGAIVAGTGNPYLGKAAASAINGAATFIDCYYINDMSVENSLLCAAASSTITYATCSISGKAGGDLLTSTITDCTIGFGGSLTSSGISAGISRKTSTQSQPSNAAYRTTPKVNRYSIPILGVN